MRRIGLPVLSLALLVMLAVAPAHAASAFAVPAFASQWQTGELLLPNFWGPLATARVGQQEAYGGVMRTVQYFDKGRMENTPDSIVTSGLLATELVKGQVQTGDATFTPRPPPAIPIAGDANGGGPTYAQIAANASLLLAAAPNRSGRETSIAMIGGRAVVVPENTATALTLTDYDAATGHNVLKYFALMRGSLGTSTLGLAITEPFVTEYRVAGKARIGIVQVFERRVLTLDPGNPPEALIEFGNIGQHYYQWRYTSGNAL